MKGQTTPMYIVAAGIVFLIILFFSTVIIIGPGMRGVKIELGRVTDEIMTEGVHFVVPFINSVDQIDIKTLKYETDAEAASKDLQTVSAKLAINYHIVSAKVAYLRRTIGLDWNEIIIQPAVQEAVKASTAQFTAEELISKREEVRDKIKTTLKTKMANMTDNSIEITEINIVNFDFSPEFNKAIEAKVVQEQEALRAKNLLAQKEYEAQQAVATAEGVKQAKILTAQGEAEAIRIQVEALKQNSDILQLRAIERWDGKMPSVYVAGSSGSGLMFNIPMPTQSEPAQNRGGGGSTSIAI